MSCLFIIVLTEGYTSQIQSGQCSVPNEKEKNDISCTSQKCKIVGIVDMS